MDLFRLFGFAIDPQRLVPDDLFTDPLGGALPIRQSLRAALAKSLKTAEQSGMMTQVTLDVDQTPGGGRGSLVRNSAINLAFGSAAKAKAGGLELARQLSRAMDERSPECLFLLAAYREGEKRRVALWIFPQDEAFRFSPGGAEGTDIELLTDIFSRTSGLRKMALFAGRNIDAHFLDAQVLDHQVGRADDVADFWVRRFLAAELMITPAQGTKVLADALKRASEAELTPEENKQVHTAALAVHTMRRDHWSLEQVADEFLGGKAKEAFLASVDNDEARTSVFRLDREALERGLNVRNFRLPEGVFVSAPITEVGEGKLVQIVEDGEDGERLRVEADVIQDRLGSRRG
jgi:hypothetical protein